ncbi:MAG: hypothetical protein IIA07_08550 [Proteobacteria bacterium]|nr:hypothetical protein [Pseudomonadota bacterium]
MKWYRKLKIARDSILKTEREPWESATAKLDEAQAAIDEMEAAQDRVAFENGWSHFVDALEESWTSFFDEGKAISSKFQPWAGPLDKSRKKDWLLRYLYEARNQSQHAQVKLDWEDPVALIAPGFSGHIKEIKGFSDGSVVFDAEPYVQGGEENLQFVHQGGGAVLPTVVNGKTKETFPPPTVHQGLPIDVPSPVEAARLGVDYYRGVLLNARKKFGA